MSKAKLRLITLVSLAALFVASLVAAIFAVSPKGVVADAITYAPSSVFAAGTGGEVGASQAGEGETSYIQFTLSNNGKAHFRRDLALKWYEAKGESDTATGVNASLLAPGVAKYYTMTFAFPEVNFSVFEISYESAEENITKDGLATNTLVFTNESGAVSVSVKDAYYDPDGEEPAKQALTYTAGQDITVSFSEPEDKSLVGDYVVTLQVADGDPLVLGEHFRNIGGNFLEYRSSANSTPSTPMTFRAELPANSDDQLVTVKSLNGQTFEVGTDGRVTDNAAPVLVLNEQVYSFRLGQRYNLTHEAVDVCDDSVSVSRSYYMARKEDDVWKKPKTDNSDYTTLTSSTFFMPTGEEEKEEAYVSIRFELDDGRDVDDYFVYLTWYAANDTVVEQVGEGDEAFDYIVVDLEAEGPEYTVVSADENAVGDERTNVPDPDSYDTITEAYQTELTAAAEKVSAGDGAYLYLPSLRALISSAYADYRNLRFSVYYYKPSQEDGDTASSSTSLRYNNLRIEVDEVGEYKMRVIAQDASNNTMKLFNEDKEYVSVSGSNVWDIKNIPEFTFHIGYNGPTIEEPGEQALGYRDDTYTITDFDIIALEGYEKEYTLYRVDESQVPVGENLPTVSDFAADAAQWVETIENWDAAKEEGAPKCLVEVEKYNSAVSEDDDEWDRTDNAYEWDPDNSLSFRPQERGIYVVKVVVADAFLPGVTEEAYQVIEVRNPIDTIPGQSKWLQNNVTAVVLFSISAVLLVAIIVLFVVKPSDKKVEEVDLDSLKGKKEKKNGKK